MTLNEMIQRADQYYPEHYLSLYWNPDTRESRDGGWGDTLALFITREIGDTFPEGVSDNEQIDEVCRALRVAVRELENVIKGLENEKVDS